MVVGVLALQGGFARHCELFRSIGAEVQEVRTSKELEVCHSLVIPGGESTSIAKQLVFSGIDIPTFAQTHSVWGTCAGLILMAKFGLLDIDVERNAYGRQTESFSKEISLFDRSFEAIFIRAPKIIACRTEILATLDGVPVLVRQGKHLGSSFHPELTQDPLIHHYFLAMSQAIL